MPVPTSLSDLNARTSRFSRELAVLVLVVLLVGMGALSQPGPAVRSVAVTAAADTTADATGDALRGPERHGPSASRAAHPAPKRAVVTKRPVSRRVAAAAARPVQRWLPTGTGMWIHEWSKTEGGNGRAVVAKARAAGLTHLFVHTGSSGLGWIGGPTLSALMPATKGTDLKVVAWDFPTLVHPEADARRLARAAWWHKPGVPMVAAVAPDIETASEGTRASRSSINRYYRTLRASLPARVAILATVPWPSRYRVNRYPYVRTARYSDAIIPMAYWYNNSPSTVTATSMRILRAYGKPVLPVGQGYDGRLDAPYLPPDPHPGKSVDAFVTAARMSGARSISLWSWQTTGAQQWRALVRASKRYAPQVRAAQKAQPTGPKSRKGWRPGHR